MAYVNSEALGRWSVTPFPPSARPNTCHCMSRACSISCSSSPRCFIPIVFNGLFGSERRLARDQIAKAHVLWLLDSWSFFPLSPLSIMSSFCLARVWTRLHFLLHPVSLFFSFLYDHLWLFVSSLPWSQSLFLNYWTEEIIDALNCVFRHKEREKGKSRRIINNCYSV